jgi:hypothetical protein
MTLAMVPPKPTLVAPPAELVFDRRFNLNRL